MRILIVGLPLFAKRLQKELTEFDSENSYYCLDTYYNKWDKIRAYFLIPKVDVIYSINGALDKSRVFDRAFRFNKKVMMTWVGTDVTKARKLDTINQLYLTQAHHYCEVKWIKEELKVLGIDARILNFFNFKEKKTIEHPKSDKLSVLSYISKNRETYYGWNEIKLAARKNPDVNFEIVGTDGVEGDQPENMHCHGWVENMDPFFNNAHCTVRFVEHDGLSGFVLESLYRGKQVLYSEPLQCCIHVTTQQNLSDQISKLSRELKEGKDLTNYEGAKFIDQHFSRDKILTDLIEEFKL